jgi:two-component system OmpR family response regulator
MTTRAPSGRKRVEPLLSSIGDFTGGGVNMRVLLLEDELDAAQRVRASLEGWPGASLEHVINPDDALRRATSNGFDVVILDRDIYNVDAGLRVVERLRAAGNCTPVLVLSSLASEQQRNEGRDAGADAYLVKPYSSAELLSVLRALLRRAAMQGPSDSIVLGALDIRVKARTVHWNDKHVDLSPTEFDILLLLAEHQDSVVSLESLWSAVWSRGDPMVNVIQVHISRLRKELRRVTGRPLVETVGGQGYVLRSPLGG